MSLRLSDLIDPSRHRVRIIPGYAAEDGRVSIGGNTQEAIWAQHVQAEVGDPIQIAVTDRPDATSWALVIAKTGPYSKAPTRPFQGVVETAPTGAETVSVGTPQGQVQAFYVANYAPLVGDNVFMLWEGPNAVIVGKTPVIPTPPPPAEDAHTRPVYAPKPPSGKGAGRDTFTASDSGTYSTSRGNWNTRLTPNVFQGSYAGVGAVKGAWFYHDKLSKLAGKTVNKVEIWLPKRVRAGSYNSPATINLYLHSSKRRPGNDVNRGDSFSLTIPSGFGGGWKTLPPEWGAALVGGSGVGISGGAYAGLLGVRRGSENSGQIRIGWEG